MTAEAATTWGVGEYSLIAERLEPAAQAVVDLTDVRDSDRVLDVACGTGNAALLAARRGATVVGLDFEPRLLDIARARARTANLEVEWVEADIQSAPLEPTAFSVIVSAFGVMYAPDHDAAAAALARCCAPGARLALAAWTPGSFMPAMGAALAPTCRRRHRVGRPLAAGAIRRTSPCYSSRTGSARQRSPPSRCRCPSPTAPRRSTS